MFKGLIERRLPDNFERIFVASTFLVIAFILYCTDQKLAFLNFYFIPVLLAGYFLNTRGAVLGAFFCILLVGFIFTLHPEQFHERLHSMGPALHLLSWGSFLILAGYLSGSMSELLRERFKKSTKTLGELNALQEFRTRENQRLVEKNLALQQAKDRLESVLHAAMDPLVAALTTSGELRSETRDISVLLLDLPGFRLGSAPESELKALGRFFASMECILARYWGHLERYAGSGLSAEFGMPYPLMQHALLAALAGLKMQERMTLRDFPWKMRVGLASGPTWFGLLGSGTRLNYAALGETVLRAENLKMQCALGQVLIDEASYKRIGRWFHARRIRGRRRFNAQSEAIAREGGKTEEQALAAVSGAEDSTYELLGLKNPLEDERRIPPIVAQAFDRMSQQVRLPLDILQPIEALEGAIGHGKVTAALCAALAQAANAPEREARTAFLAGCLHDIGKKNVPENLLKNDHAWADLSTLERNLIHSHAQESENVLRELELPTSPALNEAILQHHENHDGSGYPRGLKGEEACLPARIIRIADTYEALTGWRPYREGVEMDSALTVIARGIEEGLFDPRLGKLFLEMMRAG